MESIQLNETGLEQVKLFFPALGGVADELAQSTGKILGWLLRAWTEKDAVAKFNALFIPLEMILEGIRGELPQEQQVQIEKLHNLIGAHGGEDRGQLIDCLNRLIRSQRPSLIDRFTLFAKEANMPRWEDDVEAFRRFNRIRNGLIHQGDAKVKLHIPIGEEIRALEDLTERYVNFALFRDTAVYQSAFQHRPIIKSEPSDK